MFVYVDAKLVAQSPIPKTNYVSEQNKQMIV